MIRVEILSQLLLMQTLLGSLPDRKSVQDFVCRGLLDVPGVGIVTARKGCKDSPENLDPGFPAASDSRFQCGTLDPCCFNLEIKDPASWRDYREFVANFFFMVGMVLDDQDHRTMIRRYEAELVLKEKIASIQPMVSILAHGLNTPLGNIVTLATALDQETAVIRDRLNTGMSRRDMEEYLQRMEEGVGLIVKDSNQAGDMVKRYKELLDDRELNHRTRFRLDVLIQDSLMLWKDKLESRGIQLSLEKIPALTLYSSPSLMVRVLDYLVENARVHAFDAGYPGAVKIAAREARDQGRHFVILEISDNGKGMTEEVLRHAFDPFFTTDMSHGSGLGLSMAWNLVNNLMGGSMTVESSPGKGSCFSIRLPMDIPSP